MPVLGGTLLGLAWEPTGLWWLAFPGVALLLASLRTGDRRALFTRVLLFLGPAWGIPFHWVAFHPIPAAAISSVTALLAYAFLLSALVAWAASVVRNGCFWRLVAATAAILTFDLLIAYGPFAMPWLSPGLSTAPSDWALGWASLLGFRGLTMVLLLASLALAVMQQARLRRWAFMLAVVLIVLPFIMRSGAQSPDSGSIRVDLVEPGWSPQRWAQVGDTTRVEDFAALIGEDRQEAADIVILPETALPMGSLASLRAWTSALSVAARAPVLAGGILASDTNDGVGALNVALSSSDPEAVHAKVRLVPFAEKVPFSGWIPFFERFSVPSGGVRSYRAGSEHTLLDVGGNRIGVMICFESLFDTDARHLVQSGARWVSVLTQDGWWGSDAARMQHAAYSRLLAAAIGVPVVHTTVDGRSSIIRRDGTEAPLEPVGPSVLSGTLTPGGASTLFLHVGNWPFFAIFAALVATLLVRKQRMQHGPHHPSAATDP